MTDHDAACTLDIPVKRRVFARPLLLLPAATMAMACVIDLDAAISCWSGDSVSSCMFCALVTFALAVVYLVLAIGWRKP